jgi:hypothetical protein
MSRRAAGCRAGKLHQHISMKFAGSLNPNTLRWLLHIANSNDQKGWLNEYIYRIYRKIGFQDLGLLFEFGLGDTRSC